MLPLGITVALIWSTFTQESGAFWIGVIMFAVSGLLYRPSKWWIKRGRPDAEVDIEEVDLGPGTDAALVIERRPAPVTVR
ncbi:MAG TPA: hypothetical protein VFC03_10760 [Acidimicrobiales bacterium]|nr:hypothetical protein [Acidimicrobiales bacterium]